MYFFELFKTFSRQLSTIAICLFILVIEAEAGVSAPVPLGSWVYSSLARLEGFGLVDSALTGSRPWSRLEAARLTTEALDKARVKNLPPAANHLLHRLEVEFRESLADLGATGASSAASYFKPVRELDIEYFYQQGESSYIAGTNARQLALNYNNDGIDYAKHQNSQLLLTTEARFGGVLLLHLRPLFAVGDGEDSSASFRLLQGSVALNLGSLEISAGRQSLWWGPGRHGALIISNNAKPLDMVRLTNPSPVLLPWIFRYFGPFRFDFFVSRLEKDRGVGVSEPYFGGLRLNIKPLPCLEVGASRTVMFGGEGRSNLGFDDLLTIIGGGNHSGNADTSNSVAALDMRLNLPWFGGVELYGEMGGEDEAGGFISNKAYLAGLYFRRLAPEGRTSLRLEYADLSHIDENSPVWYRHETFKSGYTYEEKIMGHHVGGAGEDFFAEVEMLLPADITARLSFDYEKRGVDQPVPEHHRQPAAALEWQPSSRLSLVAAYAYDRIGNADFVQGQDRESHLGQFGLRGNW